ncbi:MAG: hypothetical protein ACAH80_04095 [Alphaproteobacteria bacterium]
MDKLPPLLKDFIKSVEPDSVITPIVELEQRFIEGQEDRRRANLGLVPAGNFPRDSVEFIVEIRVREWMMRVEAEKREAEARRRAAEEREKAAGKPPEPPKDGKKITPKSPPPGP